MRRAGHPASASSPAMRRDWVEEAPGCGGHSGPEFEVIVDSRSWSASKSPTPDFRGRILGRWASNPRVRSTWAASTKWMSSAPGRPALDVVLLDPAGNHAGRDDARLPASIAAVADLILSHTPLSLTRSMFATRHKRDPVRPIARHRSGQARPRWPRPWSQGGSRGTPRCRHGSRLHRTASDSGDDRECGGSGRRGCRGPLDSLRGSHDALPPSPQAAR